MENIIRVKQAHESGDKDPSEREEKLILLNYSVIED